MTRRTRTWDEQSARWETPTRGGSITRNGAVPPEPPLHDDGDEHVSMLEVAEVRVQRVQEISGYDALAEGVLVPVTEDRKPLLRLTGRYLPSDYSDLHPREWDEAEWYRTHYAALWDSINSRRPGRAWHDNPWVWAITFRRLQP